jgi:hypothetical protein
VAYEITGRAIYPLRDLIAEADFPLADFVGGAVGPLLDRLYYTDAETVVEDRDLVIDVQLAFEGELALRPPGTSAIALVLASGGVGWSAVHARFTIGPELSVQLIDLTLGLRLDPGILRTVATGAPAEFSISADVTVGPGGIAFSDITGATLEPAYLLDTKAIVAASDVRIVFGPVGRPDYVDDDFVGITFDRLTVKLPSDMLELDPGAELDIVVVKAAIGTTGFTGQAAVASGDLAHPVTGKLLGFPFRFRQFHLDARENALLDLALGAELRITALENGAAEKWVAFDFQLGSSGTFQGALSAVQPTGPDPAAEPDVLVDFQFDDVLRLGVRAARVTRSETVWALYLSGSLKLLFDGASDWPAIAFDEIGVSAQGHLLMPEGGGIGFDAPLSVDWHFARLTIEKFRFGRPDGAPDKLRIALTGEIILLESLPAGASIEGLVVEWTPGTPGHDIRFDGIGIELAVPGSFHGKLSIAYVETAGVVEFRGTGVLEIAALDMAIDVGVVCGRQSVAPPDFPEAFSYLYLFADAKLLPTGIPIAQTGLSIYGFQGLVAHNMALALDPALPVDERYYQLFIRDPIGITDLAKWQRRKGHAAFGFGVVLGTADKGYALNAKGMLVIALPDLTILLQARVDFIKQKPDLSTSREGSLDALMLYATGDQTLLIDITAHWGIPKIVSVDGHARAYFSFDDPHAWYLEIGRDEEGKRVTAKALYWNNGWLFTAGFWFRLDDHGVVTGAQVELELRRERGGFWVSVGGSARGEMKLFWEPPQWEGSLAMSGQIRAGYSRWSVGITLSGEARARVRRPIDVHLHVEACIDLWLDSICKGFDFDWQQLLPPELDPPIRRWAATPRHFTPYEVPGADGVARLEAGIVTLEPGTAAVPLIQPHSVLSLDFAKPMVDATAAFNEAVALDNGGFLTIGEGSGWSAAYRIDTLTLTRDPDGTPTPVPVWGTWARETLEPNTTLRILSSDRYGEDGSLTGGFVEGANLDYCDPPRPTRLCVCLAGISPGHGHLARGLLFEWLHPEEGKLWGERDRLTVLFPGPVTNVTVDGRSVPTGAGKASVVIWGRSWGSKPPQELCYEPGHGTPDWQVGGHRGGLLTGNEAWTVPSDIQVMPPLAVYELRIDYVAQLRAPDGTLSAPLGAPATINARFQTAGPPSRAGALEAYVARAHPAAGARPAFHGYDLSLEFFEDYVPKLYLKVGERLGLRLFDGEGRPVVGPGGEAVLLPLSRPAPTVVSIGNLVWQEILEANVAAGCAAPQPIPPQSDSGLALPATLGAIGPNTQYRAELVSDARPDVALAAWSFTTSRFATFRDLVTAGRVFGKAFSIAGPPVGADFESMARALGIPTIGYVDAFTVTPLIGASTCSAILLEAPEPLAVGTRTGVKIGGNIPDTLANIDGTRVIVLPPTGGFPLGTLAVELTFRRDAGQTLPRLAVSGDLSPETVSFSLEVALP